MYHTNGNPPNRVQPVMISTGLQANLQPIPIPVPPYQMIRHLISQPSTLLSMPRASYGPRNYQNPPVAVHQQYQRPPVYRNQPNFQRIAVRQYPNQQHHYQPRHQYAPYPRQTVNRSIDKSINQCPQEYQNPPAPQEDPILKAMQIAGIDESDAVNLSVIETEKPIKKPEKSEKLPDLVCNIYGFDIRVIRSKDPSMRVFPDNY
ncbi:Protein CBG26086 [Caenorhabditis briggsae]|uniref:Protein CBG26086 n=2 Tax=Caenorhabditis briggsae TaxID=6238 RepID=B6IJJ6_CAEBR|nr:Protein CBG26086 [Caenorhabditis briggsae]ULT98501.1 hypothetical protein L3Y34_000104 [Caenorhabditis briggsae]CAS00076.1 Protein CBG26086 [Caenorhabditis briggsae]